MVQRHRRCYVFMPRTVWCIVILCRIPLSNLQSSLQVKVVVAGVPTPRVSQLSSEHWDGVPLLNSPFSAAWWGMGGEKPDRSGQLGMVGYPPTFTRDHCCSLGTLPRIKIMCGPGNNPNNSVVAFTVLMFQKDRIFSFEFCILCTPK